MQTLAANLNIEARTHAVKLTNEVDPELGQPSSAQVFQDLMIMRDRVGEIETLRIYDVLDDGSVVYEQDFGMKDDVMTYINVWEEDGSQFFHYTEDKLENTVEFTTDGSIYLDGKQVIITTEVNESIIPFAGGFEHSYSKSIPGGTTSSEYTGSDYTANSTSKIDFNANFISITIGAIVAILTGGLSAWIGVTAGIITSASFNKVANWLKSSNPYYQYASFKDIRNSRPKDNLIYHYKHSVYAWNLRDYQGAKYLMDTYYQTDYPR